MAIIAAAFMIALSYAASEEVLWMTRLGVDWPLAEVAARDRFVFLCYASAFVAVWLVYFASNKTIHIGGRKIVRTESLRNLLVRNAETWAEPKTSFEENGPYLGLSRPASSSTARRLTRYFRDKAKTSLQSLGMLIATAALELSQINYIWNAGGPPAPGSWSSTLLGVATLCSIGSFAMLVVSIDALDSVFNEFRDNGPQHDLVRYFYQSTKNRRYLGLVLLLASAVLITGERSPTVGAMAIGVVLCIGYGHWFPRLRSQGAHAAQPTPASGYALLFRRLLQIGFICLPIALHRLG